MKALQTLIFLFFVSTLGFSQNGINYKALIKDTNGNVIANEGVDIVFSIQHEGVTQYSELQQIVTDNNGIAIATIGIGSAITGTFNAIDWKLRQLELNVQIDFGDGLVDFGNSPFNTVPYAIESINKEGLIRANGGWRLEGVITDGDEGYGDVGDNATDLSVSDANGVSLIYPYGATGEGSFSTGRNTVAFGNYSNALGQNTFAIGNYSNAFGNSTNASGTSAFSSGRQTSASGANSTAMGVYSEASGEVTVALGASAIAAGNYSTSIGRGTYASSYASTAVGQYNFSYGNPTIWYDSDPLFQIGNGSSNSNRNNALTVFKNGSQSLYSNSYGMRLHPGNTSDDFGIEITSPGGNGLVVNSPGENGIIVSGANNNGLIISASNFGASFIGGNAGLYASSIFSENDYPDIILGSAPNSLIGGDDGIISTNPNRSSSDMFLRSYDAIVMQLDFDNNEGGNFRVRNGSENIVFDINESGDVDITGILRIGTETIEDGGSDALRFNASLLPDTNNNMSLGNSSLRWTGLWATDGTINTSDRRSKTNITSLDYGLTDVLKLNPVSFNWKTNPNNDTKLGLIAQDLLLVIPEAVKTHDWTTDDDGNKTKKELNRLGVYYSDLIPVLIKAIQEQQKIIENEKSINSKQNAQLEALLSRIENLESNQSN